MSTALAAPAITERPILFTCDSVRAILEGRKTQTRRVVKPQPKPCDHEMWEKQGDAEGPIPTEWFSMPPDGTWACRTCGNGVHLTRNDAAGIRCPYGVPGHRLWVREPFMFAKGADIRESYIGTPDETVLGAPPHYAYRATAPEFGGGIFKWRPSVYMPRWASRIMLEVVKVRVERVQGISWQDALAEGIQSDETWHGHDRFPVRLYAKLWDSINGKKYPWLSNPWVWVIDFKRATVVL